MELLELARQELIRSNADRRHPFRFFSLATFGEYPEARWVVKRRSDPGFNVLFFTDDRSPKVAQMQANPKVTALFFHPKKKLQIRLKGEAELIIEGHRDYEELKQQVVNSSSNNDYRTQHPPGTALDPDQTVLFDADLHFAAAWIRPHLLDILELNSAAHKRSACYLSEGTWVPQPLVP